MRVFDIYAEACEYLATNDQTSVFRVLTRAAEYLANKGDWDILKGYVDLPIQQAQPNPVTPPTTPIPPPPPPVPVLPPQFGNFVVLPWQVDTPLKFTINDIPAFSKDRLYEFSLNGFGSNPGSDRTDYSWEDRGFIPTSIIPPQGFNVTIGGSLANVGKRLFLQGIDMQNNEVKETMTIDGINYITSIYTYAKLTEVNKEVTTDPVPIYAYVATPPTPLPPGGGTLPVPKPPVPKPPTPGPPPGTLISIYQPPETNPRYRMLRLSQTGVTAHFLFRRKVFQIVSMDDFIPIQSQLGFLTMVQAIQALRRKDYETAKTAADAAVEITTDAQRATTGFIELANNTEVQEARSYNIYNRDSVIVLDIYDDVAKILGNVGQFVIFDTITTALELLCNKGHYDGLTGYADIIVDGWRYVTLPRFIDQPVTISVNGRPAYMRNKWSEFHLNGPGTDEFGGQFMGGMWPTWSGFSGAGRWGQIHAWDSVGEVVTITPLKAVSQLVAIPDNIADDGKTITVYGFDENGKWIRTGGQDGFVVVVNHAKLFPVIGVDQTVAKIERITRQTTQGFVHLWAYDNVTQTQSFLLGYYYPDETEPRYFRIKLPFDAKWIRLRYRKRTYKVTSVWQPLHLHSRMAIITMVRSLKTLETDAAGAQVIEDKAVRYLDDDQKARNPGEVFQLQFDESCGWNSNFIVS